MNNISIEKMQLEEIRDVAHILTDAFITNPAYSIIFKKEGQREDGLLWLFKTSLLMQNHKQVLTRVIKEKDTQKIIGTFTIVPPGGVKNNLSIYSKIGLPSFISKFGFPTLFRMLKLDSLNKKLLMESMQTKGYYYLSMVVIKKEYQGKGVGSYAVKQVIEELISSNPACRLIGLTTQLPENVTFYSRLGFEKLNEGEVSFENDHYYNYNMSRRL